MEVTVGNNLGVGGVVLVGVDVSLVAGENLAANSESGGVKNVKSAGLELLFGSLDSLSGAGSCDLLVDSGQLNSALVDALAKRLIVVLSITFKDSSIIGTFAKIIIKSK